MQGVDGFLPWLGSLAVDTDWARAADTWLLGCIRRTMLWRAAW